MPFPWQHNIICNSCPPPTLWIGCERGFRRSERGFSGHYQRLVSGNHPPASARWAGIGIDIDPELVVESSVVVTPNTVGGVDVRHRDRHGSGGIPFALSRKSPGLRARSHQDPSRTPWSQNWISSSWKISSRYVLQTFQTGNHQPVFLNQKEELLIPLVHNQDSVLLFQLVAKGGSRSQGFWKYSPTRPGTRSASAAPHGRSGPAAALEPWGGSREINTGPGRDWTIPLEGCRRAFIGWKRSGERKSLSERSSFRRRKHSMILDQEPLWVGLP